MTSKALFITADADVVVYGVNKEIYSADAFLALPLDVLGKKYFAGNQLYFTVIVFCRTEVYINDLHEYSIKCASSACILLYNNILSRKNKIKILKSDGEVV